MLTGNPNLRTIRPGGSLSARDLQKERVLLKRALAQIQRGSIAGSEGFLTRGSPMRPVKLVWGRITARTPVGPPPPPPTGPAGSFTYKATSFDGGYSTATFQRPVFQAYNDIPTVIAAPTQVEDFKNSICILAIDAPDSDNIPSVLLIACRERLDFELCVPGQPSPLQQAMSGAANAAADSVMDRLRRLGLLSTEPATGTEEDDGGEMALSLRLDDLLDVASTVPTDGQALVYRTATKLWAPETPATAIRAGYAILQGSV